MSVDLNDPEIRRIRGELLDPSSGTSWYVPLVISFKSTNSRELLWWSSGLDLKVESGIACNMTQLRQFAYTLGSYVTIILQQQLRHSRSSPLVRSPFLTNGRRSS
jgi:hypothetical protein